MTRTVFDTFDGVKPFFANLHTCSSTCVGVTFNHEGGVRL